MQPIQVVVRGALGRMGSQVTTALCRDADTRMVAAVDVAAAAETLTLPGGSGSVPLSADLGRVLAETRPDVLVDFSIAGMAMPAVREAAGEGVNVVVGTSGVTGADLQEIDRLAREAHIGAVVASNFALGAVLMMHLARIAARHLDHAEIIELHHDQKADAPSGTAASTARAMTEARGRPFLRPAGQQPSRGEIVDGVNVHSVRLPGLLAHQEVILGAPGQTLSIRHDTISRESFMPGVMLAVKEVMTRRGLVRGLEGLLGLEDTE